MEENNLDDKTCNFCKKKFTRKRNCVIHLNLCKVKKKIDIEEKQNETKNLNEEIQRLKEIIVQKDEQIKLLKEMLENKSETNKVTNINSNNKITINNIFANIDPIDFKSDESKYAFEQKFLNHHIDKGQEGLVRFMCENICKDKIVVSDIARKKLQYKNTEGKIVTDHKGELLLTNAIKENTDIFDKKVNNRHNCIKKQLKSQKLDDEPVDKELYEKNRKIKELIEIKENINNDNPIDINTEAVKIFVSCGNKTKNNLYLTA